jgi:hypothetical protein
MAENYVLLETIELTQAAASVTFDNIPPTGYTDLKIVASARTDTTTPNIMITLNGSTSSFTNKVVYGTGSSVVSTSYARFVAYGSMSTDTTSAFGNSEIYIPNYAGSTNKSFSSDAVHEKNATAANAALSAGLWSNTAAITSVGLSPDSGNFVANSTFSLYGIASFGTTPTIAPKASGGNIVANDGTYWYHAFLTSGTFTPLTTLSCDALVVAGGGGGSYGYDNDGGGGGAGGLRGFTAQSLTGSIAYSISIGSGGTAGGQGNDSSIAGTGLTTFTSAGGGVGGGNPVGGSLANGGTGGSGGGGWAGNITYAGAAGNTPSTSPSQGNNGGSSYASGVSNPDKAAGGGGGAGAVGTNGTYRQGGNGGVGSSAYSSWGIATNTGQLVSSTRFYAGGGGGGADTAGTRSVGGSGGGGGGGGSTYPGSGGSAGTANTGGGGGGGGADQNGFAGGSGIVIFRYTMA